MKRLMRAVLMKMSKRKAHVHPNQDSATKVGFLYKNQPVACLALELLPKPLGCSSLLELVFHLTPRAPASSSIK